MTELPEPSETAKAWTKLIAESPDVIMFNYLVVNEITKGKDVTEAMKVAAIKMEKLQELEKDD